MTWRFEHSLQGSAAGWHNQERRSDIIRLASASTTRLHQVKVEARAADANPESLPALEDSSGELLEMAQGTFIRLVAWPTARGGALAALLAGLLACLLPSAASAQWDTMLRTFLQNAAPPSSQPPPSNYPPPAYYGQQRPTYSAPPAGAYQPYPPPPPAYYGQPRAVTPTAADRQRAAEMQRMLDDLGYDAGPASGSWGERSREALRGFLRDHGQPASGEVTPVSQAAVRSAWHERGPAVTPSMPATANGTPSFDCRRATAPAEIAICRDPSLAELDRELAEAFRSAQAAATGGDAAGLSAQQRAWMRRRDACGANPLCLRQTMAGRLAALRQMPHATESAAVPPTADTPPAMDTAGAAAAQTAASRMHRPLAASTAEFDAPPVNRLELLKLLMASRPDLFRNNVVPLLYRALIDRWGSPECARDMAAVRNELRLDSFIAESRTWMDARIAEAAASPVVRFRIDGPVALGPYDEATGAFEVPPQQSAGSILSAKAEVPYGYTGVTDVERATCPIDTPSLLVRQAVERNAQTTMHPVLHVQGGEAIRALPMPRAAAAAWLDTIRSGSPTVRIETVVEATGQQGGLVGRVVAARAVDPNTGAVLHTYDPSLFGAPSPPAAPPAGGAVAVQAPPTAAPAAWAALHARAAPSRGQAAPPADFRTLFGLLLAARPDMGKEDDAVLLWRAVQLTWNTPECEEFRRATDNQIKRRDLVAQLRPSMQSALDAERQAGPTRSMTVSLPVLLAAYDKEKQRFALLDTNATPAARRVTVEPRGDWCHGIFAPDLPANGLSFVIDDGGVLTTLPMTPAAAAARLDLPPARQPRSVRIDAVVNIVATEQGLAAQLVSAKAMDPQDGDILHVYAPEGAAPAASAEAVPATHPVLAFEALRLDPGVLDDAGLLQMTKSQIELDQYAYQAAGAGGRFTAGSGHVFAFALEDVRGKNPDFAAPELAPRMRALLTRIAATAPGRLYAGRTLFGSRGKVPDYDHATSTLRLRCCYLRPGLAPGWFELLSPPAYFPRGANLATKPVPPGAATEIDRRAIYTLELPKEPNPPPALDAQAAGLGFMGWQGPEVVALDRVLELDGVKLPPTEAEQVFQDVQSAHSVPDAVYSRVVFTPERLISAPGGRGSILLAHLEGAELVSPSGRVFARFPASAFPSAAERATTAVQQAAAASSAGQAAAQKLAEQKAAEAQAREAAAHAAAESADASVRRVAANALAGVPYGPDVVGLRLGMEMAKAEDIVRHHMTVGMVLEGTPGGGGTGTRDLGPVRIFVNADKTEQIVLLDRSSGKVLAVQRTVAVPEALSDEQLLDTLRAKYGPPLPGDPHQGRWEWGKSAVGLGFCLVRSIMTVQFKQLEGPPPPMGMAARDLINSRVGFATAWDYAAQPAPSLAQVASCEARLEVSRNATRMFESLYDARIFAVQAADAAAKAASQAAPPAL